MAKKLTYRQKAIRKHFLARVQGPAVEAEIARPPSIMPKVTIDYWVDRLLECEIIDQTTANRLKTSNQPGTAEEGNENDDTSTT